MGLLLGKPHLALLLGFDTAGLMFLASLLPLLNDSADEMRRAARANDANRSVLLANTVGTLIAEENLRAWGLPLIVGTVLMTWVFSNTVFALHYAHLYYLPKGQDDRGGLDFSDTKEPDYWGLPLFSFTLGMIFQTSDVSIGGTHIRSVVLGQSMAAFVFNMGILAFTINAFGGL